MLYLHKALAKARRALVNGLVACVGCSLFPNVPCIASEASHRLTGKYFTLVNRYKIILKGMPTDPGLTLEGGAETAIKQCSNAKEITLIQARGPEISGNY